MNGTVILGQVEVCFLKTNLPFSGWVEKSVKCDDLLFQKRFDKFVNIMSKHTLDQSSIHPLCEWI